MVLGFSYMRGQGRVSAKKLNQAVLFLLPVISKHFLDAGCSLAKQSSWEDGEALVAEPGALELESLYHSYLEEF